MGLYGKLTPVKCTGQQNQLFCSIRFKPFNLIKGLQIYILRRVEKLFLVNCVVLTA